MLCRHLCTGSVQEAKNWHDVSLQLKHSFCSLRFPCLPAKLLKAMRRMKFSKSLCVSEAEAELHSIVCRGSNADVAAAATITDLQAASKALQGKGGMDPFPAAMQVPCASPTLLTSLICLSTCMLKTHPVQ